VFGGINNKISQMNNKLSKLLMCFCVLFAFQIGGYGQSNLDTILPVRGFCISVPTSANLDEFVKFINTELAPRQVNTLVVRVEYKYQFKNHPELIDSFALSKEEVKKIVKACKKNNIRLIPLIDLLGHQSGGKKVGPLLRAYPQFDETPQLQMADTAMQLVNGFNMKSYCPLHPDLHKIIFEVIDEICDVFEADAFHAGMDEVFDIGNDKCPRCSVRDKAELFAGEVLTIHDHLAGNGRALWIWGDRLIDGKTTGIGRWEASYNNTYRAVDMIPKDVVICDWHYERPDQTPVYFAMKGFNVITCPWKVPRNAVLQVEDMIKFRQNSTPQMKQHFYGMMQTIWSKTETFFDGFYGRSIDEKAGENTSWNCFREMYNKIDSL
jgi:hypothetical protein